MRHLAISGTLIQVLTSRVADIVIEPAFGNLLLVRIRGGARFFDAGSMHQIFIIARAT